MKSSLIAPLLLGFACTALAADTPKSDTPADYGYTLPLQVSGKQGVVGLRLPTAVYQHARSAGLNDVRIFDAKGQRQPHALYLPPVATPEQRSRLPATIFTVKALPDNGANTVDLDIRTRADGSVVSVHTRSEKNTANAAAIGSLILDFGAAATADNVRIEALRFMPPAGQRDYTAEVWLETSANLKDWHTAGAAELRWLTNDSASLASDRLEFAPRAFRYARLTWRRGEALPFASIQAETITRQSAEPQRNTLWIQPAAGKKAGDLVYPAGVAIPAEQITLRFTESNIVYPVAVGQYVERPSRKRDNSGQPTEWIFQPQAQATFYQITQNGQTLRSSPAGINSHAQEWVLRPQNPSAGARPELGISWQPATLVFLTGGTPPYTLGFGRADADNAALPLNQVAPNFSAQELGQIEQVQTGALQAGSGGGNAESAALQASLAASKRSYVLWGVLLLGVLVLAGLTWKLVKQMGNETGNKSS